MHTGHRRKRFMAKPKIVVCIGSSCFSRGNERNVEVIQKYLEEHGNLNIPATYKTDDGIWLGRWIYEQRRALQPGAKKTLPIEKREKLKRLGIRNAKTAMEKYKGEKDRE